MIGRNKLKIFGSSLESRRGAVALPIGIAPFPLSRIYGWFIEKLDTADLKEAKVLLDELK